MGAPTVPIEIKKLIRKISKTAIICGGYDKESEPKEVFVTLGFGQSIIPIWLNDSKRNYLKILNRLFYTADENGYTIITISKHQ
ncbi:MAG: hypothetical protein IPL27_21150 [Lewinellaceae bacterium]|nr:hypothetical protein [Lewinellaceae bacterium]